mmetsp:Transcript_6261/g.17641  ORF Transcript_6261/g.17641 Transcript_6261/m.17641 type:complete len:288 (-) Transcript_6261:465-1328(-)
MVLLFLLLLHVAEIHHFLGVRLWLHWRLFEFCIVLFGQRKRVFNMLRYSSSHGNLDGFQRERVLDKNVLGFVERRIGKLRLARVLARVIWRNVVELIVRRDSNLIISLLLRQGFFTVIARISVVVVVGFVAVRLVVVARRAVVLTVNGQTGFFRSVRVCCVMHVDKVLSRGPRQERSRSSRPRNAGDPQISHVATVLVFGIALIVVVVVVIALVLGTFCRCCFDSNIALVQSRQCSTASAVHRHGAAAVSDGQEGTPSIVGEVIGGSPFGKFSAVADGPCYGSSRFG